MHLQIFKLNKSNSVNNLEKILTTLKYFVLDTIKKYTKLFMIKIKTKMYPIYQYQIINMIVFAVALIN